MTSIILDAVIIVIVFLLFILTVLSIRKYQQTGIFEFIILTVIYLLSGMASLADFLARANFDLFLWKTSQLLVQSIFLVFGIFALRILYDKPPKTLWICMGIYFGGLQTILVLVPNLIMQTDGGVGGVLIIDTVTILSPDFQVFIDFWQFWTTTILFYSFLKMFLEADTPEIKKTLFLMTLGPFSLLLMTIYEFFEAFFLPAIPGTIFLMIGLAILTIAYLPNPTYLLLSPVKMKELLVVTNTGLPLQHVNLSHDYEQTLGSMLLAGLLSALDNFIRTWTAQEGFQSLRLHNLILLSETIEIDKDSKDYLVFFLAVEKPTALIKSALRFIKQNLLKRTKLI